ncbi:MAG: hypothetical protein Q9O62_11765 [Ardenticatenia bacterium]|nr:hypothetical protein [Ardenticatenia bacterium]
MSRLTKKDHTRMWPCLLAIALVLATLLACRREDGPASMPTLTATGLPPTPTPIAVPVNSPVADDKAEAPLYVAIIWHQHQPLYVKDPATGVYQKPWVRLHAAKDYVDMAAILEQYPSIRVTFNLTPSLLRQLRDLEAGAPRRVRGLHSHSRRPLDRRGQSLHPGPLLRHQPQDRGPLSPLPGDRR